MEGGFQEIVESYININVVYIGGSNKAEKTNVNSLIFCLSFVMQNACKSNVDTGKHMRMASVESTHHLRFC